MPRVLGWTLAIAVVAFLAFVVIRGSGLIRREETLILDAEPGESGMVDRELELVTLLPFDAIRSIENPRFLDGPRADEVYSDQEMVLGVEIDGDARAYSVPFLSRHEVVNDVVAGNPVAVTW